MEIIYIDPGYGSFGKDFNTTDPKSPNYVENYQYNPINGVAFNVNQYCIFLMPFPTTLLNYPDITDANKHYIKCVSVKFSVYLEGLNGTGGSSTFSAPFSTGFQIYGTNNAYGSSPATLPYVRFFADKYIVGAGSSSETLNYSNSSSEGFHNVAFSIHSDNTNVSRFGTCDVDGSINTFTIPSFPSKSNAPYGTGFIFAFNQPQYGTSYVSNIILATSVEVIETELTVTSPSPILSSDTTLIKLPLSTPPSGNFSAEGDGKYVGTASGQQLVQTIDATDLITKFGGDTKVNNLIVYGNPGYKTGNGITTAYGISNSDDGDNNFTTHGSCTLSADPNAVASVAWEMHSHTLSDIDGLNVGWRI